MKNTVTLKPGANEILVNGETTALRDLPGRDYHPPPPLAGKHK